MRVRSTPETAVLSKQKAKKHKHDETAEIPCACIRPQGQQQAWLLHIEQATTHPHHPHHNNNETSQRMKYTRGCKNEKAPYIKKNLHMSLSQQKQQNGTHAHRIVCRHPTCVASIFLRAAKSLSLLDQSHTNTSECTRLANASGKSGLSDRAFR